VGWGGRERGGAGGRGVVGGGGELLEEMPPFLGGGEMIETVWMERSTFAPPPHKFEAGTMPIAQAVGLAAAIGYLTEIGRDAIREDEHGLISRALEALAGIHGLRNLGAAEPGDRGAALSVTRRGRPPPARRP